MIKKILFAVAAVAATSFASYDYYALPEAGHGTVKGQFYYDWDDPWSQWSINASARYIVIPNLEISVQNLGYRSWETDRSDGAGFTDLTIGGRYAIMPILNVFLDLNLPIGSDDVSDRLSFTLGAQYTQELVPNLLLGTEAGFYWGFEKDNSEPGLVTHIAGEVGYLIQNIGLTPFVGLQFKFKLTDDEWDYVDQFDKKHTYEDNAGDNSFSLWLGASYAINQQMAVDAKIKVRGGDSSTGLDGEATGIEANFYFNF